MKDPKTPDQILNEALSREQDARDFYERLANQTTVTLVRELLEQLKGEESKHVLLVQNMIARLNGGKRLA